MRGDSMAFLGVQGGKIVIPNENDLQMAHITAAPPFLRIAAETITAVEKFIHDLEEHSDKVEIVKNGEGVDRIIESGKIAVILGLQHTPYDADEDYCKRLQELNVKIVIPDYNGWTSGGLTDTQTRFVTNWIKCGGIIDLSHASHDAARDVLFAGTKSSGKIIASHTGCYDVYSHPRNLPDDVLSEIVGDGGYVGISAVTFFLGNFGCHDMVNFLNHIKHAKDLTKGFGVGIGSDMPYIAREACEWQEQNAWMKKVLDPEDKMGVRFPDFPFEWACHKSGKIEFLSEAMRNFGFTSKETGAVTGGNFYRWAKENI